MTNYSTVSSVIQRVTVYYERDNYLLKEIEALRKNKHSHIFDIGVYAYLRVLFF